MKYRFYHTFNFWDSMTKTIGIIGGGANVIMGVVNEAAGTVEISSWVQIACGIFSLVGLAMGPWLRDHNSNGILDIFEPVELKKDDEV